MVQPHTPTRIIRRPEVERLTGQSRSTIYARTDPKSEYYDPEFPEPIKLGTGKNPPVGWIEAEIEAYIAKLIARSRGVAA